MVCFSVVFGVMFFRLVDGRLEIIWWLVCGLLLVRVCMMFFLEMMLIGVLFFIIISVVILFVFILWVVVLIVFLVLMVMIVFFLDCRSLWMFIFVFWCRLLKLKKCVFLICFFFGNRFFSVCLVYLVVVWNDLVDDVL